jgi:hypothetical protein
MRKKIILPIGVIALVSAAGVAYAAYAYQGDPVEKMAKFSPQKFEQMQKAYENNDYGAWKEMMNGRGRITSIINEQNFPRFAEMHRLMLEKKFDQANQIREELGLGQGSQGWRNGNRNCSRMGGI